MDHAGYLAFVLGFYRDTVAAVTHGDDGILKIIPGASCNQRRKLGVDPVVGGFDAAAYLTKGAAGIVTDLILGKDTAADLCAQRCERFQCRKHSVKGIGHSVVTVTSGIGFDTAGIFQKTADGKQLRRVQGAAYSKTFQCAPDILDTAKGNAAFFEQACKGIVGLQLHGPDFLDICGRGKLPAEIFSHGGGSLVCQQIYDFIVFKCFVCFFVHCCYSYSFLLLLLISCFSA